MTIRNLTHARTMLDHQQAQVLDARITNEAPTPADIFPATLRFRRELRASEQVSTLSHILANAHYLYEGWQTPPPYISLRHKQEAERAIRACSEPCRSAATTAMENYVVTELERLSEQSRSCDVTRQDLERAWKRIARMGREVYDWHLLHETGRSAAEMQQLDETPLEEEE